MANSLNMDLTGKVVLIKKESLSPEYQGMEDRRFKVGGGFGANPDTEGTKLFGTWLSDGSDDWVRGWSVEAIVEEET